MKRKYCEIEVNSNDELFSDLSDEESYIVMVDKLEEDYFKRQRQQDNVFTCDICNKMFNTMQYLNKHKLSHSLIVTCDICSKNFTRKDNLKTHKRRVHGEMRGDSSSVVNENNSCDICFKRFTTKSNLTRHKRKVHNQESAKREWKCRHCLETFSDYSALFNHVEKNHPLIPRQTGGRQAIPMNRREILENDQRQNINEHINSSVVKENESNDSNEESALKNSAQKKTVHPTGTEKYDMLVFLANRKSEIRNYLLSKLQRTRGIKWNLCIHVEMERDSADITQNTSPYFRSRTYLTLTNETFSEHDLNEALQKIHGSMEKFLREGSGWYVKRIIKLEISIVIYSPLTGSSYIPLPASLVNNRRTFLNIENNDNKCALWCILASLHPADTNAKNVELYKPFQQEVDMNNIEFPMTLHSFDKFENQNPAISVNVFGFESNEILPLRITKNTERLHHVNLLLLKQGELSHYCLIKDLNGFLSRSKSGNIKHYFCPYCLQSFINQTLLHNHLSYCSVNGAQKVVLPSEGEKILKFRDFYKTQKVAFVIYVDFECINRKLHTCMPNPELSHTTALTKLEVCSYAYKVQSINPNYCKPVRVYRGENALFKLIEELLKEQEEIEHILSHIEPMVLSDGDRAKAESATSCCICQGDFTLYDNVYNRPVYHHCHVTGLFLGKAHSHCNLQCRQTKQTCVVLHNLRNFDAHIICEAIGNFKDSKLTCIAQNTERYVSFSLGNLRFIDSYQFLPSSLDNLVNDLAKDGIEAFPHMLSEFTTKHQAEILTRKGVYPYEQMDSFERFKETCLPEKNAFYSQIKLEGISDEDYEHAKNVFRTFKLKDMGEYHDLYLKCDVLLLCDVFEAFRNVSMEIYGIDPAHCYTSPGLSWQSCLKMTKVSLELMTDIDQILFVEKGIRGGISQISNRYKRANNPLLDNYDSSEESSYLIYLDMNNLYGYAMIQKLPVGGFKFLSDTEIQCFDIMSVSAQADIGFILEVSLEYPESIHDSHNEYPLAPEQKFVRDEDLSPYAKQLWRKLHGKTEVEGITSRAKVEKLLTTLEDKDHYIVHYRNLQLYLDLGLRIKKFTEYSNLDKKHG